MMFEPFFRAVTGHAPYDHQRRLTVGDAGRPCASPTGKLFCAPPINAPL